MAQKKCFDFNMIKYAVRTITNPSCSHIPHDKKKKNYVIKSPKMCQYSIEHPKKNH